MTEDPSISDVVEAPSMHHRGYLVAAWLVFILSACWRLYFFCGFGALTDDINSVYLTNHFLVQGWNPEMAHHYRFSTLLSRALSYSLFGVTPWSHVLPMYLCSLLSIAVGIIVVSDLFGSRAALILTLLFFSTPFETLTATMDAPDQISGCFSFAAAMFFFLALERRKPMYGIVAAAAWFLSIWARVSGLGLFPLFILFGKIHQNKRTGAQQTFWISSFLLLVLTCAIDWHLTRHLFRWFTFNNFFDGYDVTDQLWTVWRVFPDFLFGVNEYGHHIFGASSLLASASIVASFFFLRNPKQRSTAFFVLIFVLLHFLIINFAPHKFENFRYFSHPRVFRYLAIISPFFYLAATWFLELFFTQKNRAVKTLGFLFAAAAVVWNTARTPSIVAPSVDANRESRQMLAYLYNHLPARESKIYTNQWKCDWIRGMMVDKDIHFNFECYPYYPADPAERQKLLASIPCGTVITGGANLPWYGNMAYILNLSTADFVPPPSWHLAYQSQFSTDVPWRIEPLRIWKVWTAECHDS